jgi:hypothetical protein
LRDNRIGIALELYKILFRLFFMTKLNGEGTALVGKTTDHPGKLDIASAPTDRRGIHLRRRLQLSTAFAPPKALTTLP